MGKTTRVVVCGMKSVGKTAILEQAIYGNYSKDSVWEETLVEKMKINAKEEKRIAIEKNHIFRGLPYITVIGDGGWAKRSYGHGMNSSSGVFLQATIEDTYVACIETERGTREKVRFYDTAGLESIAQARQASQSWQADGYVLVYDTSRPESFDLIVQLKKEIDKNKEKKELVIVILGHNIKVVDSPVPLESPASKASHWSIREKIRHFEVNALDRTSLFEPFVYLGSRLNQPPAKSGFHQLSMVRKSVKLDS